jgi:gamma-glutamyltranspeptidase/glutathione hydrolase
MAFPHKGDLLRPMVTSRRAMAASAHPQATIAGVKVLLQGGNAIDAAVAVASALNVADFTCSGIGGVGYMLIYHKKKNELKVIDYIGVAPQAADVKLYDEPWKNRHGLLAPMVPGACAGWLTALETYGTMDRATVFAHTIDIAENGFPLTRRDARALNGSVALQKDYPTSMRTYHYNGGDWRPGDLFRQPNLARTYRRVVEGGKDEFYRGSLAQEIADFVQANGGLISREDLANLTVEWKDPISIDYRGYRVYGPPPSSSAIQWLQTLKIMEGFDVAGMGHNTVAGLHHLIEAERLAIADRIHWNVAPNAPVEELLSERYCAQRRALIDPNRAKPIKGERYTRGDVPGAYDYGDPLGLFKESTTHFDVIDEEGNAVSATQSLGGFGCGVVAGETGIMLNNFCNWFDIDEESPNCIGPGKKVEMCLSPGQIWRNGKLFACLGTPGSYGIMETTPQFMLNLMDHEMTIHAAIEAPRMRPQAGYKVMVEARIPAEVRDGLAKLGNEIAVRPEFDALFGGAQGIMIDPDSGARIGGADQRRDGYAIGI